MLSRIYLWMVAMVIVAIIIVILIDFPTHLLKTMYKLEQQDPHLVRT